MHCLRILLFSDEKVLHPFIILFSLLLLGMAAGALCVLGESSAIEPHTWPLKHKTLGPLEIARVLVSSSPWLVLLWMPRVPQYQAEGSDSVPRAGRSRGRAGVSGCREPLGLLRHMETEGCAGHSW